MRRLCTALFLLLLTTLVSMPLCASKGDGPEHTLAFEAPGRGVVMAKQNHDFATSPRSKAGIFDHQAVFVGYGIVDEKHQYNSYKSMPENYLQGKVAIAFNYEPQNKDGESLWMPAPTPKPDAAPMPKNETGPAGKLGKGGVGPWSPSASVIAKARAAAQRGAAALILVDGPAQDIAEPVADAAIRLAPSENTPIPVIHIRSLFFRTLLKRGGGGKDVDNIIEALEKDANAGDGTLNDETGVEQLRDVRLWGAVVMPEPAK